MKIAGTGQPQKSDLDLFLDHLQAIATRRNLPLELVVEAKKAMELERQNDIAIEVHKAALSQRPTNRSDHGGK